MGTLFQSLEAIGFLCVLGKLEDGKIIECGTPYTWDSNNGVTVVYDGGGRPWVIATRFVTFEVAKRLREEFSLKRGAGVPYSNDGGKFLHEVLLKKLGDAVLS